METKKNIDFGQFWLLICVLCKRLVWFIAKWFRHKRIRLAVLGTPASGKSFLLEDMIQSLADMDFNCYELKYDDCNFKKISEYYPNENGGNDQTPFYSCRQENIYAGRFIGGKEFILEFLNIPGEAFTSPDQNDKNSILYVDAYNKLVKMLLKQKFTVTTYAERGGGDVKLIVEPSAYRPISSGNINKNRVPTDDDISIRKTNFLDWNEILDSELEDYERVIGLSKNISGKTLLKHFFEYQIDSVIKSVEWLIKKGKISGLGFSAEEFSEKKYDRAFVFLHYCNNATDMVMCDRIMNTGDGISSNLWKGLSDFIDNDNKTIRVYFAFRCVDKLLYSKEKAYMELYDKLSNILREDDCKVDRMEEMLSRNIIYSVFHSLMLRLINNSVSNLSGMDNIINYAHFIGLDIVNEKKYRKDSMPIQYSSLLLESTESNDKSTNVKSDDDQSWDKFIENVTKRYLDNSNFKKEWVTDKLGERSSAQAFRELLQKTGVKDARVDENPIHVYFTCTPIACDYKIYRNFNDKDGSPASDFVREDGSEKSYFRERSSNACFGSYQLCMDILIHHDLKQLKNTRGLLLQHLTDHK